MYLSADIMNALLSALTNHFPSGAIAFDAFSPAATRMAGLNPSCAQRAQPSAGSASMIRGSCGNRRPGSNSSRGSNSGHARYAKLPLTMRALVRVFDSVPGLRKLSRLLLYRF